MEVSEQNKDEDDNSDEAILAAIMKDLGQEEYGKREEKKVVSTVQTIPGDVKEREKKAKAAGRYFKEIDDERVLKEIRGAMSGGKETVREYRIKGIIEISHESRAAGAYDTVRQRMGFTTEKATLTALCTAFIGDKCRQDMNCLEDLAAMSLLYNEERERAIIKKTRSRRSKKQDIEKEVLEYIKKEVEGLENKFLKIQSKEGELPADCSTRIIEALRLYYTSLFRVTEDRVIEESKEFKESKEYKDASSRAKILYSIFGFVRDYFRLVTEKKDAENIIILLHGKYPSKQIMNAALDQLWSEKRSKEFSVHLPSKYHKG